MKPTFFNDDIPQSTRNPNESEIDHKKYTKIATDDPNYQFLLQIDFATAISQARNYGRVHRVFKSGDYKYDILIKSSRAKRNVHTHENIEEKPPERLKP